ncbi:hypothetical protein [Butyrivibrio sp. JL13D10]|uniref:hypothetical protein n=1 Tax=Butyrivibrio sp. JL13D10 TaxID=3236815 RepID=UPI0038B53B36
MKKILKQMVALTLALVVAFTFAPVKAQAAGVKVTKSRSGSVKAVYYKGGPAKKATFKMTSTKLNYVRKTNDGQKVYDCYEVVVTLKRPKLSNTDIIKSVSESVKKNTKVNDFTIVAIDANGNTVDDGGIFNANVDMALSSSKKTIKAKQGRHIYYINDWVKKEVVKYEVLVPHGQTGIYIGIAGLKNGQVSKSKDTKYKNGKISYIKGGYGSSKKGFVIAGSVTD